MVSEQELSTKIKLGIVCPGGGTRGIITTRLLTELNNRVQKLAIAQNKTFAGIESEAKYIAGTSIGSVIVSAIVNNYTAEEITGIFKDNAGQILEKSSLLPFTKPYYSSHNLERILSEKIGDQTIGAIDKKVLITSYNLEKSAQTIFTNFGCEDVRNNTNGYAWGVDNIKLKDAVHASSAVPGMLASKEIAYARDNSGIKTYHEIDGAMQNNSPVMDLVIAMNTLEKVNFENMFILSIGTGTLSKDAMEAIKGKGILDNILSGKKTTIAHLCAVQDAAENHAKLLVEGNGGKFFRLDPQVSVDEFCNALDDSIKQMNKYEDIADLYIQENDAYLNEVALQIAEYCLS